MIMIRVGARSVLSIVRRATYPMRSNIDTVNFILIFIIYDEKNHVFCVLPYPICILSKSIQ